MVDSKDNLIEELPNLAYWLRYEAGQSGLAAMLQYKTMLQPSPVRPTSWPTPDPVIALQDAFKQLEATVTLYQSVMSIRYGIDHGHADDEMLEMTQESFLRRIAKMQQEIIYMERDIVSLTDSGEARWLDVHSENGLKKVLPSQLKLLTANKRLHDKERAIEKADEGRDADWLDDKAASIQKLAQECAGTMAQMNDFMHAGVSETAFEKVDAGPAEANGLCLKVVEQMQLQLQSIMDATPQLRDYLAQSDAQLKAQGPVFSAVQSTAAAPVDDTKIVYLFGPKKAPDGGIT